MKSILLSTRPKWCKKICHEIGKDENGKSIYEKQIEVRKSKPSEVPFKAYIYMTATKERCKFWEYITAYQNSKGEILDGSQKIIGEFICDKVYLIKNRGIGFYVADEEQSVTNEVARQSCLDYDDMVGYLGNKDGYGLHITALKIYNKPKELSEFRPICKFEGKDLICNLCPNHEYNGGLFFECRRKVTRPPQSWCYVEEL